MLDYSVDLSELMKHYQRIWEILCKCIDKGKIEGDDRAYLVETGVSSCAIQAIVPMLGKGDTDEIHTILRVNGIL